MKIIKRRTTLSAVTIFVILLLSYIIFLVIEQNYNEKVKEKSDLLIHDFSVKYRSITSSYKELANILFKIGVDNSEIYRILGKANSSEKREKDEARKELAKELNDFYNVLKSFSVRQLHFHLPGAISFLRFHKPEKYGDDLTNVRHSIVKANKEKIIINGFEEGRIFNGFRNVFPLEYQGNFLGTVEISFSFNAIKDRLQKEFSGKYAFVIKEDVVRTKVFKDLQNFYKESQINKSYYAEKNYQPEAEIASINNLIKNKVTKQLKEGKAFAIPCFKSNEYQAVAFYPIQNVKGNQVGYMISYAKYGDFKQLYDNYLTRIFVLFIFTSLTLLFSLLLIKAYYTLTIEKENLRKAKIKADAANTAKSEFLANMSHEIRTPMNAILGYSELLQEYNIENTAKNYLEGIHTAGINLLSLINSILDLAKIESGKMNLEKRQFNLPNLFSHLGILFELKVKERGNQLKIETAENLPEYVHLDEDKLRQVLINLIGNATKFTKNGTITVKSFAENVAENNFDLLIEVSDTGIGIPKNDQARIFEAFTQQDGQSTREYGGTGLGLTISKRFINLMNGEIKLKSRENIGTTFTVIIRNIEIAKIFETKSVQEKVSISTDFKGAKILVVDDVKSNRSVLKATLRNNNVRITEKENGLEAVNILKEEKFDMILMDMQMPIMNGYEAIRIIKEELKLKTPVIAFTASALKNEVENIKTICEGVIRKPATKKILISAFVKFLDYVESESKTVEAESCLSCTLDSLYKYKEFDTLQKHYREVKELMSIDDIKSFAENLLDISRKNKDNVIVKFSANLSKYAENFDIEKANKLFLQLEKFFK